MTVETKLPYDKSYVENYSVNQNEPAWMKELRLQALEQAEHLEMPKPDKTKINRWNFTRFKHGAEGETFSSLKELPAELEEFLDKDNAPENLL
ncbi:Fe-S cluster assembly protein SufD, partial [Virgibacillus halodenitrificans]|nr:Fe-S cluster assembly protein SufD [Virgibacillus halodenitrificans]